MIEGYEAWVLPNGLKNPNSTFVLTSLDYDPTASQEMLSDGNIHVHQNFYAGATDSAYTDPKDITFLIGQNDIDDGLGIYPTSFRQQLEDDTDNFREIYDFILNSTAWDYSAESYLYIDDGPSPDAFASLAAFGVNAEGDFGASIDFGGLSSQMVRSALDSFGSTITSRLKFTTDERSGYQRVEDDGAFILEQDLSFFGTDSSFAERATRLLHDVPEAGVSGNVNHLIQILDDSFVLTYANNRVGGNGATVGLTSNGTEFTGDISLTSIVTDTFDGTREDDYTITGLEDASKLLITTTSPTQLTGVARPSPDRSKMWMIQNSPSSSSILTLVNQSAFSDADGRFSMNSNTILQPGESRWVSYELATSRNMVIAT